MPSSVSLLPCIAMRAQLLVLLPIVLIILLYTRFISAGRQYTHSSSFGVDYHYDNEWPYSAGFCEHPTSTISSIYWVSARVVYCVVTDLAPSQRHDKIGMMTARHHVGPCRYRDGGGKSGNFTVTRGRPRWISHGHVR